MFCCTNLHVFPLSLSFSLPCSRPTEKMPPPPCFSLNAGDLSVGFFLFFFFFFSFWTRIYAASETYQLSWRLGRTLLKHWIETLKFFGTQLNVTASNSSRCSSVQLGWISFFAPYFSFSFFYFLFFFTTCVYKLINKYILLFICST